MAAWARSERTFAIAMRVDGAACGVCRAPLFFGWPHRAGARRVVCLAPDPSKLRVNKSVCALARYFADDGSGDVAEFTSRNHACVVSPGA